MSDQKDRLQHYDDGSKSVRSGHIELICRVHIAREIEAASRAARFGITATQAAQVARGQEPTGPPTRRGRGG